MLTNAAVKTARPRAVAYELADAGGLHLYVTPKWRISLGGQEAAPNDRRLS